MASSVYGGGAMSWIIYNSTPRPGAHRASLRSRACTYHNESLHQSVSPSQAGKQASKPASQSGSQLPAASESAGGELAGFVAPNLPASSPG